MNVHLASLLSATIPGILTGLDLFALLLAARLIVLRWPTGAMQRLHPMASILDPLMARVDRATGIGGRNESSEQVLTTLVLLAAVLVVRVVLGGLVTVNVHHFNSVSTPCVMAIFNSGIEWTDATWNCIYGCTRKSPGCLHCYAEAMAARFSKRGLPYHGVAEMTPAGARWTNQIRCRPDLLDMPLQWQKKLNVFVNSMSDTFHEAVPLEFILEMYEVMNQAHWHQFQVLTKRSERLLDLSPNLSWSPNIWAGVSVENADYKFRIDHLRETEATVKFLSLEPLLAPLPGLNLDGIDWVIAGGESGAGCRPLNADWIREIRDQCLSTNVPFFFKQYGHLRNNPDSADPSAKQNGGAAKGGRTLDGSMWSQMPGTFALPVIQGSASAGGVCCAGI